MSKQNPVYGICDKCGTNDSELFEYEGRWLCKANACYAEEVDRNKEKQFRDQEKLNDYRKLVQGTRI